MSNPSGTAPDDPAAGAEVDDSDPITEVIDIPANALYDDDPATASRRYTAPGFDAGSTQIIDRLPDPPTEFLGYAGPRPRSAPMAIPARIGRSKPIWRVIIGLFAVGVIAGLITGAWMFKRNSDRAAQENAVRATIETFNTAVQDGDLATLRSVTCGQTRENYVKYDDQMWTDTYSKVMAAKQYPVVASVDAVVVNKDHAEANVTSYMAFDPATKSTHSFDLQFRDNQWKICQSS